MLAQTNIDNLPHGYAAAIQVADILLLQLSALKTSPSQLALHSNPHPLLLPIPVAPSGDVLHNSFCFCWRWLMLLSQCSQRKMQAGPHQSPPRGQSTRRIPCARNTIGPTPHYHCGNHLPIMPATCCCLANKGSLVRPFLGLPMLLSSEGKALEAWKEPGRQLCGSECIVCSLE